MIKPTDYHLPANMDAPHFAFVVPGAIMELPDGLVLTDREADQEIMRLVLPGLYSFQSAAERDKFVRKLNAGQEQEMAYKMSRAK